MRVCAGRSHWSSAVQISPDLKSSEAFIYQSDDILRFRVHRPHAFFHQCPIEGHPRPVLSTCSSQDEVARFDSGGRGDELGVLKIFGMAKFATAISDARMDCKNPNLLRRPCKSFIGWSHD